MQKFEFLRQPLLGELAMSRKKKKERRREKNAIYSGHLRLCQQPRAVHTLRSDQNCSAQHLQEVWHTGNKSYEANLKTHKENKKPVVDTLFLLYPIFALYYVTTTLLQSV